MAAALPSQSQTRACQSSLPVTPRRPSVHNTDTAWNDDDRGVADRLLPPPDLAGWTEALRGQWSTPLTGKSWCQVRYAIAYDFGSGSLHRSGWWSPSGNTIPADEEGYVATDRGCPRLDRIACDPTGQAVARVIYRQFRGQAEREIGRIPNNTETTFTDSDLQSYAMAGAGSFALNSDNHIYEWTRLGWAAIDELGTRIAVGPAGQLFVVNSKEDGVIRRRDGGSWTTLPGAAQDIAVGNEGSVFVLGTDQSVYKWNGSAWDKIVGKGRGTRIAVGHDGTLYMLTADADSSIWRYDGSGWTQIPGAALDLAIADDGKLLALQTDHSVCKWTGSTWIVNGLAGSRIAAGPRGQVVLLGSDDARSSIWIREDIGWKQLPGAALDLAIGGDGTLFVLGSDRNIYKWTGSSWERIDGHGTRIAVGPKGQLFRLDADADNSIWRRDGNSWTQIPGTALDLAVDAAGRLYVLGVDQKVYRWTGAGKEEIGGGGTRIAVGADGQIFVINADEGHSIWRRDGQTWTQLAGAALDLSVGADGSVLILGMDRAVYKWTGSTWAGLDAKTTGDDKGPVGIAAGPAGHVLLLGSTDGQDKIRCRVGERWLTVPGGALQVAVGGLPPSGAQLKKPLRKSLPKTIALRASNGKYVSAAGGSDKTLQANSSEIGSAETFLAVPAGFGKFGLLAAGGYDARTRSDSDTQLTLCASSEMIRGEETFAVYDLRASKVALQAAGGTFVGAAEDEVVSASSSQIGRAETFTLVEVTT